MTPDATPERDTAEQEARLASHLDGDGHKGPVYFTLSAIVVIVLGFALAIGLALMVLT